MDQSQHEDATQHLAARISFFHNRFFAPASFLGLFLPAGHTD
jgi:hypothetical protein